VDCPVSFLKLTFLVSKFRHFAQTPQRRLVLTPGRRQVGAEALVLLASAIAIPAAAYWKKNCLRFAVILWVGLATNEAALDSPHGCRSAVGRVELAQDILDVFFDRFNTDIERRADLPITQS